MPPQPSNSISAPEATPPAVSARLRAVARCVASAGCVADIGSDHLRLPHWLLRCGQVERCIATDLHPARGAARLIAAFRGRLEFRLGDGLQPLEPGDAVEVVCLAGLGARSMIAILGHERRVALRLRRLVLQPQTEPARLRRWLVANRFEIVDEALIEERRQFYPVIVVEPRQRLRPLGHPALDEQDLLVAGPCLVRSGAASVGRFWRREALRWERALAHAAGGPTEARVRRSRDRALRVLSVVDPERLPGSAL